MIYCSHCGADNIDDGSYCVRCGSRLGHVDDNRGEATSTAEAAVPPQEDHGNGTEDHSPNIADTKRHAGRASKRTRWAVLAVALLLVVGGSVAAGVMLHRHGRGPGSSTTTTTTTSTTTTTTLHLTAAQSCTLATLNVTKYLWTTSVSDWSGEIYATQQLLQSQYGSGSRRLNAFNAAVSVGFPVVVSNGVTSAQIAEMVPVATACGSTHPRTWLAPAPKKKTTGGRSPTFAPNVPASLAKALTSFFSNPSNSKVPIAEVTFSAKLDPQAPNWAMYVATASQNGAVKGFAREINGVWMIKSLGSADICEGSGAPANVVTFFGCSG